MVSTGSIRLALKRIAEAVCGVVPRDISVLIPSAAQPRVYIASVPAQYRAAVYQYLAERVGLLAPQGGDPLVLTADVAEKLLKLADSLKRIEAA